MCLVCKALVTTLVICAWSQESFVMVSAWGSCRVSYLAAANLAFGEGIFDDQIGRVKLFHKSRETQELRREASRIRLPNEGIESQLLVQYRAIARGINLTCHGLFT